MATVKLQNGKVILKNGKVSCSCCKGECCSLFDCESLLGYWRGNGAPDGYESIEWSLLEIIRPDPDSPPQPSWQRDHGILTGEHGSCVRFVCIKSIFNGESQQLTNQSYCGPTCTNLDLFNTVISNVDGSIFEETACFIFALVFYGWVEDVTFEDNRTRRRFRECSDTAFSIHYAKLIPIQQ